MHTFVTAFTVVHSLIEVDMLPQLLMGIRTVAHEVREIKTYGLSKMSYTTKHHLSSLFIFLLNLPYVYMESSGPSLP